MVRQRSIRDEAPLPDNAILVPMLFDENEDGSAFDRAKLIVDATLNFTEFGYYGLSMWGAADLRDKDLGIVPSGAAPHYDASVGDIYSQDFGSVQITASSAEELIDRFITATYTRMQNEHVIPPPN